MILTVNLVDFYSNFLNILLDANKDGKTAVFVSDDILYAVSAINNNSIFLYNTYKPSQISSPIPRINFNASKLKTALTCIKKDEHAEISLSVEDNKLLYKDDSIKFHIRLLNDNIVAVPNFNINTFNNLKFDFSMELNRKLINELKRGDAFCTETNKFYFAIQNDKPCFIFGDKTNAHTNEMTIALDAAFTGNVTESVFESSILRMLFKTANDVTMKINEKVLMFEILTDNSRQVYLTTKLKK
jgi:hypothetical protein